MSEILETAEKAAIVGGQVLRKYFCNGADVRYKGANNLVTTADLEAEEAVVSFIKGIFPDHRFLGEETYKESSSSGPLWVIDPLDGTTNCAHGLPHFACSVGFFDKGQFFSGAVYAPILGDLFLAERGKGAFHGKERVRVSQAAVLSQALVATGFSYERGPEVEETFAAVRSLFSRGIHGIRRFGAASLDLCYVGIGRFDAYFEMKVNPWDIAAGVVFVEEAGGKVTKADGSPPVLNELAILATNGMIHEDLLSIISQCRNSVRMNEP